MNDLHVRVALTQGRFSRRVLRSAMEVNLLPGQPKILEYLYDHDGCTHADLCQAWDLDKSTVSGLVERLERDGLVRWERDTQDRRRKVLFVTPEGMHRWLPMQERLNEMDRRAWREIPQEDQKTFLKTLDRIYQNLSEWEREE